MNQIEMLKSRERKLAVVGLGYVGLPLAAAFSKHFDVIGFDLNEGKLQKYRADKDVTCEVGDEALSQCRIDFTSDPSCLREAGFVIVAVPTPICEDKTPDLTPVIEASKTIGRYMEKGTIVVFESTVYPGVTENVCAQAITEESGMVCGRDFYIGYSPERINPGDPVHKLQNVTKIVSGMDAETLDQIAAVYGMIINPDTGGAIYRAEAIRVAEAAKLAENAQRDVNIAFMNELSMAFHHMDIRTIDVIRAMNTKWNAMGFYPGLVGGHCIGVDPYYFLYDAELVGSHSTVISAGRKINEGMAQFVAQDTVKELLKTNCDMRTCKIYILGMTFKGNCPDLRNSKAGQLKKELEAYGLQPEICDPYADREEMMREFGKEPVCMEDIAEADCLIFAAEHKPLLELKPVEVSQMFAQEGSRLVVDIRNIFKQSDMEAEGLRYWSL